MADCIEIRRYVSQDAPAWNSFVQASANATFLHDRRFMEYHADRFEDHSLIVHSGGKTLAVLPANRVGNVLQSHGGLTYGGFVVGASMSASLMVDIFVHLREALTLMGITQLAYKAVPHIFHKYPAEQDVYALVQQGAQLVRCDLSSAIAIGQAPTMSKSKRQGVTRAQKAGLKVSEASYLAPFWSILTDRLSQAYQTAPTHNLSEIEQLQSHFPDNIRLFTAQDVNELRGGILVFECGHTVHVQYMATNEAGRISGALDLIIDYLVRNTYRNKRWFNFGVSTTQGGQCLNVGLSRQKEMFGARSVVFNQYEWNLV